MNVTTGELEENFRRLYDAEFSDTASEQKALSLEDKEALSMANDQTRLVDGQFEIPLPWRKETNHLPDNRLLAERRLGNLKARLDRDADLRQRYTEAMQRNIKLGYCEKVEGKMDRPGRIWFLPHHPVLNPKKPEKTRVVFDCAARFQGTSLNDRLLQGPDLTTPLVDVLCRFRLGPIAVAADIQEMFMQVKVPVEHRDALRFLWWTDGDLGRPAEVYRFTVHPFGAVSSPFCANYALRATAAVFGSKTSPFIVDSIRHNFYVDDLLCSFEDEEEAKRYIVEVTQLLQRGGFHLTKWLTNSRLVLASVQEEERATNFKVVYGAELPVERALGVQWNAEWDSFVFILKLPERETTRRGLLSAVSSLYDPLGFVAPWLLPGKMLLQRLCRKRMAWDQSLDEEDKSEWANWQRSVVSLGEVTIPRALPCNGAVGSAEMHLFADASETGYGTAVYGCWITDGGKRERRLLFAKARVAPLKVVSIPRLELTAATLAIKVGAVLRRSFIGVQWRSTYWTDSAIVLHYIRNCQTRFSTFVANRLAIIHEHSSPEQWRHVASENNPADYCSRGLTTLKPLQTWLEGPAFLTTNPDAWPNTTTVDVETTDIELKRTVMLISKPNEHPLLTKLNRYSSFTTLLRAVVWWTRFKEYLVVMSGRGGQRTVNLGAILSTELKQAEHRVLYMLQESYYAEELRNLREDNIESHNSLLRRSTLRKLNPVVVDGLLRVDGRLGLSNIAFDAKHPIILPTRHHVTTLIIQHIHTLEGHAGVAHLWTAIRRRFWVVQGRQAVRRVLKNCPFCRRQNAIAGAQLMAPLPTIRTHAGWRPFADTGLDYFGPLQVRVKGGTEKRYGCIMTCMQSRAIHLEVAHSLATDSFLMALQRFISRRGVPNSILSDNGSNFVGAHNELRRWTRNMSRREVINGLSPFGIEWRFNPPYASHRGGVWERMIRSVRRAILAVGGHQIPTDETLATLLVEVERIVNNRPLVPVTSDISENLALTPNDLLILHNNSGLETPRTISSAIQMGWKQAQHLATTFWRRWTSEYLPTLQQRQRWLYERRPLKAGDVVLVIEGQLPRDQWPIGVVRECLFGQDGLVRTARVRTKAGEVVRDIRKLCYLEGDDGNDGANEDSDRRHVDEDGKDRSD